MWRTRRSTWRHCSGAPRHLQGVHAQPLHHGPHRRPGRHRQSVEAPTSPRPRRPHSTSPPASTSLRDLTLLTRLRAYARPPVDQSSFRSRRSEQEPAEVEERHPRTPLCHPRNQEQLPEQSRPVGVPLFNSRLRVPLDQVTVTEMSSVAGHLVEL
jgi:hypothetical protein